MPGPAVELKILDNRLRDWGLPRYQTAMAAAIDLLACLDEPVEIHPGTPPALISSGIAVHIGDPGMAALVLPRSGLGHKQGLVLGNLVGLIDADYTGPLMVSLWNRGQNQQAIEPGDRIAQLVFMPVLRARFVRVDEFAASARGAGGFGHTGVR